MIECLSHFEVLIPVADPKRDTLSLPSMGHSKIEQD